jgi:hypothetical protein
VVTAARQYTTELGKQFNFNANWTPGVPLALGDIGAINSENVFVRATRLENFGISFAKAPVNEAVETYEYATSNAVEIGLKLAAKPSPLTPNLPLDAVGLGIKFTQENATVFRAEGATHSGIDNEPTLAEEVVSLIRAGDWDRDWCIITHLVHAKATTALVAKSSEAAMEFKLSAGITAGGLDLLSADAGLKEFSKRNMELNVVAEAGMTPLFRAKKVRRKYWLVGKYKLREAFSNAELEQSIQSPASLDDELFEDAPYYSTVDPAESR